MMDIWKIFFIIYSNLVPRLTARIYLCFTSDHSYTVKNCQISCFFVCLQKCVSKIFSVLTRLQASKAAQSWCAQLQVELARIILCFLYPFYNNTTIQALPLTTHQKGGMPIRWAADLHRNTNFVLKKENLSKPSSFF